MPKKLPTESNIRRGKRESAHPSDAHSRLLEKINAILDNDTVPNDKNPEDIVQERHTRKELENNQKGG